MEEISPKSFMMVIRGAKLIGSDEFNCPDVHIKAIFDHMSLTVYNEIFLLVQFNSLKDREGCSNKKENAGADEDSIRLVQSPSDD